MTTKRVRLIDRKTWAQDNRVHSYEVPWVCTVCGGPRGDIKEESFPIGDITYIYDSWSNPCGHNELHEDALKQAVIPNSRTTTRRLFEKWADENPNMVMRESQVSLAEAVEESSKSKVWSLIEAGTGTGKSKGYLVPLVLSGQKATISTATKSLQDQVYFKDLQEVMADSGIERKVVLYKGAGNYLCKYKTDGASILSEEANQDKVDLFAWVASNPSGDLNEYPGQLKTDRSSVNVDLDICVPSACPFKDSCPWVDLKSRVADADIIVTNHTLLFYSQETRTDRFLVIDEGHEIPKVASSVLQMKLNMNQNLDVLTNISSYSDSNLSKFGLTKDMLALWIGELNNVSMQLAKSSSGQRERIITNVDTLNTVSIDLSLDSGVYAMDEETGMAAVDEETGDLLPSMSIRKAIESYIAGQPMENLSKRLRSLINIQDFLNTQRIPDENLVKFCEIQDNNIILFIGFRNIGPYLNAYLWSNEKVLGGSLLSATLKHNGYFDYMLSKLQLPEGTPTLTYESPFNYDRQARIYIPADNELVDKKDTNHHQWLCEETLRVILAMKGRSIVLFTSYQQMTSVYEAISPRIPYKHMIQGGDMNNNQLKENFITDINSVLFATKSFWTGFDVPGESLSCVIIPTLPFPQMGDPFVKALSDTLVNPLYQYMVPEATLELSQGAGRLIRKETDKGVIAILDPRIVKTKYGKQFLTTLPDIEVERSLDGVVEWFSKD